MIQPQPVVVLAVVARVVGLADLGAAVLEPSRLKEQQQPLPLLKIEEEQSRVLKSYFSFSWRVLS